jgi:multidrug resistance efflux pump
VNKMVRKWGWMLPVAAGLSLIAFSWGREEWVGGGRLVAEKEVIASPADGVIARLAVSAGDAVAAHTPLFTVGMQKIGERLQETDRAVEEWEKTVSACQLEVDQAVRNYVNARAEMSLGVGSQEAVVAFLEKMQHAQEEHEAAKERVAELMSERRDLEAAAKDVEQEALYRAIVSHVYKREGEKIVSGDPVVECFRPDRAYVEISVEEKNLEKLAKGNPVQVRFLPFGKREWRGTISAIEPEVNASGQVRLKIALIDEPPPFLGISAELKLCTERGSKVDFGSVPKPRG